jgi:DNA gyrase/topoisomerase IV subunit B
MRAEIHKDGGKYVQEYSQGKKKAAVKKVGSTKEHGSIISFKPDEEIFKELKYNLDTVINHLRQQAYLVKGLRVVIIDAREWDPLTGGKGKKDFNDIFWFRELGLELPSTTFYLREV